MDVFVSWSGVTSRKVAEALRDWLPDPIPALKPWMSDEDLESGSRWGAELETQLVSARVGILCVTPENLDARWIHFEAGAISKSSKGQTLVCPYLCGLQLNTLKWPLRQFQAVNADRAGTRRLVRTLNRALPPSKRVEEARLDRAFGRCWKDLSKRLATVALANDKSGSPTEKEMLEDIWRMIRTQPLIPGTGRGSFTQKKRESWSDLMLLLESTAREARSLGITARDMGLHELRSKSESLARRMDLINPSNFEELQKTLWWMGERGTEEDVDLLERIRKSPPFSEKEVCKMVEVALTRIRKRLADT